MTVIGIVGLPGSGKSEAANVARKMNIPVVATGDIVYEECRRRGLDPEVHHGEVAKSLLEEGGPTAIAERALPAVRNKLEDNEKVLIEGIRSDTVTEFFREEFRDEFTLISIEAPFEVRIDRIKDRDDSQFENRETLRERDERERSFGIGEAMQDAEIRIENTGTIDEFRDRMEQTFNSI